MKGILNKLTPEKFGKLVDTVKTIPINTTERLSAVIDLIFEKVSWNLSIFGVLIDSSSYIVWVTCHMEHS